MNFEAGDRKKREKSSDKNPFGKTKHKLLVEKDDAVKNLMT
jgi:hypothetical protein